MGDSRAEADARACWLKSQGHDVTILSMDDRYPSQVAYRHEVTEHEAEHSQNIYADSWRTTRSRIGD